MRVHPRHRLDLGATDVAAALRASLTTPDGDALEAGILRTAGMADRGLVCLSVRSAWDLLLQVLAWPAGSEVIVTGITHPDMITIMQSHGIVPVPVDLDLVTLAPSLSDLERAGSGRTRAVLVVHLFGGLIDLAPILAFCRRHDLMLVEDSAQAFAGRDSLAPTGADVSMISFGMIKTASAVGGALLSVTDTELRSSMRKELAGWPGYGRLAYAMKVIKAGLLMIFNEPRRFAVLTGVCRRLGVDLDAAINSSTRSFAVGGELRARIRRRPPRAMLALLGRRLQRVDQNRLAARAAIGEELTRRLPAGYLHPGDGLLRRTHWLYPVLAPDPDALVAALRACGIDVSRGTSNLVAVSAPDGSTPARAGRLMSSIVYLPSYPELGEEGLERLVAGLQDGVSNGR
jgi:dTDP-4-amino-4,6-dideoxygalactose transaminase